MHPISSEKLVAKSKITAFDSMLLQDYHLPTPDEFLLHLKSCLFSGNLVAKQKGYNPVYKMRITENFVVTFFITTLLFGCGKGIADPELTKEEQVAKLLSGNGNKVWRLRGIKENNIEVILTTAQLQYIKTYTLTSPSTTQGHFTDFDGYTGDWSIKGSSAMQEVFFQTGGTGFANRDYTILSITDTMLSMYYVQNNKKIEGLYRAY